jgi:hypothetical protein
MRYFIIWLELSFGVVYFLISLTMILTSLANGAFYWKEKFGRLGPYLGLLQGFTGIGMLVGGIVFILIRAGAL